MENDDQSTQRVHKVKRDATFNYYEAPPTPTIPPRKPFKWGWAAGLVAVLGLGGGTLATTQLNAQTVYYCASHNSVKYHTDATCPALKQCSAVLKSTTLGQARSKMDLCKMCPK